MCRAGRSGRGRIVTDSFKYDVAFTFLAPDEPLAARLADQLGGRVRVFLYPRQQEVIAGTDGEQTFNRVFGEEARIVVVLYRADWGQTPFTRIEETAIRNRAFEQGYDFVLFIPLDPSPTVPAWLPKNRIWIGLERWGEHAAASVIEARVQEAGGTPQQETAADSARRLARELTAAKRREEFHESSAGVHAAASEAGVLIDAIEKAAPAETGLAFEFERGDGRAQCLLYCEGSQVSVTWSNSIVNSLREARVIVKLWKGRTSYRRGIYWDEPKNLSTIKLQFDAGPDDSPRWRHGAETYSTAACADFIVRLLIDRVRRERLSQSGDDHSTMIVRPPPPRSTWG
jgi:hypothetical protein